MQITNTAMNVLRHTLGLTRGRREPFRNHFVAGDGHHDIPALEELERYGLMKRCRTPGFCSQDEVVFAATAIGKDFAIASLPPETKRTKYGEYLHADTHDSFSDFLGICKPQYEWRRDGSRWEYRMYRLKSYSRDVEGDWAPTQKEAKASYKAALKARLQATKVMD